MIVALHSAPKGFFRTRPPHNNNELVRFMRKAASMGFKAVQIGPLIDYVPIQGECLRKTLDRLNMKRNVHVGGIYDAEKFVLTDDECARMRKQIHYGITLCEKISSTLVSIHPPFFTAKSKGSEAFLAKARTRFLDLVREEVDFANRNHIKIALESFCYDPFIFKGLHDFAQFVSTFPLKKLGVLLDAGHLHQIGINLNDAVNTFRHRLLDIHIHDATLEKDYRKATHLPIGRGTINFPKFISILREARYNGWLTVEIRGSEKEITNSRRYLENLINMPLSEL